MSSVGVHRNKSRTVAWRTKNLYTLIAIIVYSFIIGTARGQVPKIPEIPGGLVTSQAASLVVGQKSYSAITEGLNRERWGAVSGLAITGNKLIVVDSSYLAP